MSMVLLSRNDCTNMGVDYAVVRAMIKLRAQETAWQVSQLQRRPKKDGEKILAELKAIAKEYND